MLVTKLKSGEWIEIGETQIKVEVWSNNIVKLYIDAPKNIKIRGQNINPIKTVEDKCKT